MSDPRHSATLSRLRARGRHALPWLRRNRANRWKVLLAPAILGAALFAYPALAGTNFYVATTGSDANDCTSAETPCLTIAGALAKATSGSDVVNVAAGTYAEALTITTPVTLRGAKAGVAAGPSASPAGRDLIDGGDGFVGESRITSTLTVSSNDVVVDGFVIDVASNYSVYAYGANITIRNSGLVGRGNLQGSSTGAMSTQSSGAAESYTIEYNRMSGGLYGINLSGDSNTGALTFRGNYVAEVRRGVQTQGSATGTRTITGNSFYKNTVGVRLARDGATITGNSFRTFYGSSTTQAAIRFSSETYTACYEGFGVSPDFQPQGITIQNNLMDDIDYGVYIEDPVAAPASPYTVTTNSFSNMKQKNLVVAFTGGGVSYNVDSCGGAGVTGSVGPFVLEVGTAVDASNNWWGSAGGPGSGITAAGASVTTNPFIASYSSPGTEPGFSPSGVVTDSTCTTTCYVSTTGSDSGAGSSGAPFATLGKALSTVSSGGTIYVGAGTYAATDIHVTKAVTIDGAVGGLGTPTSIIDADGLGTATVWVEANNVTLKDLTITDGVQGVRFGTADDTPTTVANTTLSNLTISANSFSGVEVHNKATVSNLLVTDSRISGGLEGIRFASTAIGLSVTVQNSVFGNLGDGSDSHIYQEGAGGSPGYINGLTVTGNVFGGTVGYSAIYSENITNVTITNNTFTLAGLGFVSYPWQPGVVGNFTIQNNTFTNLTGAAIVIAPDQQLDAKVLIDANTFSQNVAATTSTGNPAVIRLQMQVGYVHAPVEVTNNTLTLTQSGVPTPSAQYGVRVSGNYAGVSIIGNTFGGGGVSGAGADGSAPRGAGIYVRTVDSDYGAPSSGSTLRIENNRITGFRDAISFYDATTNTYGGLPADNAVSIKTNWLVGNSGAGVHNGGSSNAVIARSNWWGCAGGPGTVGCDATSGVVTSGPYITSFTLPTPARAPGFWPATTSLALGEISGPTTVPLAGESLGSPSVEIPGATAGTTIEVSAPTASELPADVTPFKVDGATLIEINVTGTVTFPVTVCLNGVLGTDKLWHYENNDWVDITGRLLPGPGSLNPANYPAGQICGMTDSFSPFALAEGRSGDPEDCTYDSGTKTLTVPIPSGGTLSVARQGSDLWVGSIDVWCGATAKAIGSTAGKVNVLNITGASGDETVTFLNGTATNWGANQTGSTTLKRVIALGGGTSDRIVIQGTGSGDALAASTFSSFASGVEIYRFEGGAGSDTLTGSAVIDEFIGDAGTDVFKGGTGNDCADYSAQTSTISANLTSGSGGNGTIGTDSYSSIECLKGSSDNDVLIGSAYGDWLYGNGGDDTLQGRGGPDALDGGDGTDTVSYTEQTYPVVVNLTVGTATGSTVGTGGDTIALGTVENVLGGSAGDTLVGNASANSLDGGAGADTLVGMAGGDTLNGNTGLDTASYDNSVGAFGAGAASTVVIANLTTGVASGGGGADTFTAIENLTGSSYNDDLTGSSAVNIINGLDGNDTVNAGEGNDTVNGGGGADTLNGEAGADTLKGGGDVDILNGGAGADPLWGEGGNDTLCGGSEGDTLRGGDGDDTLVGGTGGTGVDIMYGDGGTGDTISYHVGDCSDAETGAISFKLGAVGTQQNTGGAGYDVNGGGVENLRGGSGNDTLVGDAYPNVIEGLGGNDTMQGGSGDDTIYSGSGTSNKADGQLGTDTCWISDSGAWATTPNCEVKLP